ncbi:hypothetical protein H6503_03980 [Candidatus Woesearchaeota archaeon]|nr:hypothetical protein [Candidatus Woesearchaeota archaeon]
MDIEKHAEEFHRIRKKYGFDNEEMSETIAQYLTSKKHTSSKEFAELFDMKHEDALVFLSFIEKGIRLRESSSKLNQ